MSKEELKRGEVRIGNHVYTFDPCDRTVLTVDGTGVGWPHMVGYRGLKREDVERGVVVTLDWRDSIECGKSASERRPVHAVSPESMRRPYGD